MTELWGNRCDNCKKHIGFWEALINGKTVVLPDKEFDLELCNDCSKKYDKIIDAMVKAEWKKYNELESFEDDVTKREFLDKVTNK